MNKDIIDTTSPMILPENELTAHGIDRSQLEKISEGETPQMGIIGELKSGLKGAAEKHSADIVVLTQEHIYGGMFRDKYAYTYELYRKKS